MNGELLYPSRFPLNVNFIYLPLVERQICDVCFLKTQVSMLVSSPPFKADVLKTRTLKQPLDFNQSQNTVC